MGCKFAKSLWGCHSTALHSAGGLAGATQQEHRQGCVVSPGTAQANHHCYINTSLPLLQTFKALMYRLGFPSAAPPQHHLNCQAAQGTLVPTARPQTTALHLQQSAPVLSSHQHYSSGLIPPVLAHACKTQDLTCSHGLTCLRSSVNPAHCP